MPAKNTKEFNVDIGNITDDLKVSDVVKELEAPAVEMPPAFPREKISVLFGIDAPDSKTVQVKKQIPYDPDYFFVATTVQKLLLWIQGEKPGKPYINRNVFVSGDGGIGKTSMFLEFCARMGVDVYAKSCSGRTRFSDLVGTLTILENGSTKFIDGPLTKAYRNGGVFLANEVTRMDNGEQMALVDVLDRKSSLTVAETGEVIYPHKDFRFAATGNSNGFGDEIGAYAGEKRGSGAFLDRFTKLKIIPMTEAEEIKVCKRYAPTIGDDILERMVKFARETRNNFIGRGGSMSVCIETRALFAWATLSEYYRSIGSIGSNAIPEALNDAFLNGAPAIEAEALRQLFNEFHIESHKKQP